MQPGTDSVNNFFGIKVSKQGVPVNQASDNQLLYKNDFSTTTYYDSSGNITLQEGLQPNGTYGISMNNGQIIVSNNGVEQIIIGLLPDGTYGMVISKPGIDVNSVFS